MFTLPSDDALFEPSAASQALKTTPDGDISQDISYWSHSVFTAGTRVQQQPPPPAQPVTVSMSNVEMANLDMAGGAAMERQTSLMSSVSELSSMFDEPEPQVSPETSPEPDVEDSLPLMSPSPTMLSRSVSNQSMTRQRNRASHRHRNTFTCVFCPTPYQCFKKEDIRSHYIKFHFMDPKTRAYPCNFTGCHFSADNPTHLKRHRTKHSKEKGYRCPVSPCEKVYTRYDNLRRHVDDMHDDVVLAHHSFPATSSSSSADLMLLGEGLERGVSSF